MLRTIALSCAIAVCVGVMAPTGSVVPALAEPAEVAEPAVSAEQVSGAEAAPDELSNTNGDETVAIVEDRDQNNDPDQVKADSDVPIADSRPKLRFGASAAGNFATVTLEDEREFSDVAVGDGFALGLVDGEIVLWDEAAAGQASASNGAAAEALSTWYAAEGSSTIVEQFAAGGSSAYAVTAEGNVLAWIVDISDGDASAEGESSAVSLTGIGADTLKPTAIDVAQFGNERVAQVEAAAGWAAVRTESGAVYAWGEGLAPAPTAVSGASTDIAVSASGSLAVLLQDGSVLSGQIAATGMTLAPLDTSLLQDAPIVVQATNATVTVLTDAGSVFMSSAGAALMPVEGLAGVRALAAGAEFTVALSGFGADTEVTLVAAGVVPQALALDGLEATGLAAGAGSVSVLARSTAYAQRVEVADSAAAVDSVGEGEGVADEQAPGVEDADEEPVDEPDGSGDVRVPELPLGEKSSAQAPGPSSFMRQLMAPLSDGLLSRAGAEGCHYANPGTGAYAESLCWLDLSGFSTEWIQSGAAVTTTISSNDYADSALCPVRVGSGLTNYARTVINYQSVLGAAYGSKQFVGCGRSLLIEGQSRANSNSMEAARRQRNEQIFKEGSGTNNDSGPFYGDVSSWPIEVELPGGYKLNAKLSAKGSSANGSMTVAPKAFPTWPRTYNANGSVKEWGSFLGQNGFYTGVAGKPALHNRLHASGNTKLNLSDIQMVNSSGQTSKNFTVVVADAESTDNGESITWTTTGKGFTWLPNRPEITPARPDTVLGNSCQSSNTSPAWSVTQPSESAQCVGGSPQAADKSGTPMLQTAPSVINDTFSVSQQMNFGTNSQQAVAFGVIFARAEVSVRVSDRILDSVGAPSDENFTAKAIVGPGTTAQSFSATTGTTENTKSNSEGIPIAEGSTQLRFSSEATGAFKDSYASSWQCTKKDPQTNATTYWPGPTNATWSPNLPQDNELFTRVKAGEFLKCQVAYVPPYLTLLKTVDNGSTGATNSAEQWNLSATGAGTNSKFTVPGSTRGKKPVAVGAGYALTESGPTSNPWQHGYSWSDLTCMKRPGSGSTDMAANALQLKRDNQKPDAATGVITSATLKIAKGNDLLCTYNNTANKPDLKVKKESSPTSTTTISPGTRVDYTLTFDNNTGTAKATTEYTDYLADVLDDADLLDESGAVTDTDPDIEIRYYDTSGQAVLSDQIVAKYNKQSKTIVITGNTPAYTKATVTVRVKVKPNDENAQERQQGDSSSSPKTGGYRLSNYLLKTDDAVPTSCTDTDKTCTTHPIRAWTVRKGSQPQDGAVIHSGGNIYYRVTVTNYSGEALTGVVIQDDLSETLAATRLDLNAPAISSLGAVHGVNFYDASGKELTSKRKNWSTEYNKPNGPELRFVGDREFAPSRPGGIAFPGGTWTYKTPKIDFPEGAVTAVIGYVVKGGSVADPDDPASAYEDSVSGSPLPALPNAVWVNTVQASSATVGSQDNVYPNRCSAAEPGVPAGDVPDYYDCKTWHELGDSYFHLWKKSAAEGTGASSTGKNLMGSAFVLADTEALAAAGTPSRWLCRTNNNPNLGADYVPPGSDPSVSGEPDFGEESDTWAAIAAWNITHPNDQKVQCGLFYHLDVQSQGQAAGSWRAVDVRGGDLDNGGTQPLSNWRTASAANDGDPKQNGRHGTYWVAEMKSPTNHQLLAKPFKLWVAPAAPTPSPAPAGVAPGNAAWYDYQGRLSMPVVGAGESAAGIAKMPGLSTGGEDLRVQCADAWALPANNQPACVMPTGWTAPIFDAKLSPLPLTGGTGTKLLTIGGAATFVATLTGVLWWRRRKQISTTQKFI